MKALKYDRQGEPWDVLGLVEMPPPGLERNSVLIRLEAAPLHIADLLAIRGDLSDILPEGGVPGFEGVGRILACGEEVPDWKVGDRVILPWGYGTCQEILSADPKTLLRAPGHGAAEQLALVRINLSTADLLLRAYRTLSPGDWIIQNAANSNVAGFVAQLAEQENIRTINIVRREQAAEKLRQTGRAHVLVDGDDLAEQVAKLTGEPPVLAFDAVGGDATRRLGKCVANGGTVVSYGYLSNEPHAIDFGDLIYRDIRLVGMMTDRAFSAIGKAAQIDMNRRMEEFIASQSFHAEIAAVYPFSQAAEAFRHAARTGTDRDGKVILVPA